VLPEFVGSGRAIGNLMSHDARVRRWRVYIGWDLGKRHDDKSRGRTTLFRRLE